MERTNKPHKPIILSQRLQAAVNMVTPGNRVGDVGCDHGWVSVYLVEQGISPHVIATDINAGPLGRAAGHIAARNLSSYIETRHANGFAGLRTGEVETVILAGMGGPLMCAILRADVEKTGSFQEIILQPQSKPAEFRRFIDASGYRVVAEDMVAEEDKFYPLMKVMPSADEIAMPPLTETEYRFGRLLLSQRHPVLHRYLHREKGIKERLIKGLADTEADPAVGSATIPMAIRLARGAELRKELKEIDQLLAQW